MTGDYYRHMTCQTCRKPFYGSPKALRCNACSHAHSRERAKLKRAENKAEIPMSQGTDEDDKRNRMTHAQSFEAMKLIEANGSKNGDYWEYHPGWSDEKVAETLGVSAFGVISRRKAVFGNLKSGHPNISGDRFLVELQDELRKLRISQYEMDKRIRILELQRNVEMKVAAE